MHPPPQSCAKGPTPRIPFAPRVSNVSVSVTPKLLQAEGTAENVESMTCTGTLLAVSPAIFISAACTGPQVNPLTKGAHSPTGLPKAVCCGREGVKAPPPPEVNRRSP